MKKNYPMRVGALLLALTLVTSCFVGGTFAKYVTSGKGEDTARVAKFGVTVTGEGTTFAKAYDADDEDYTVPAEGGSSDSTTGAAVTVQSSGNDNVVAPGTKGDMAAFTITGTPEVAVKVTYEATEFELGENWIYKENESSDGIFYCPLIITINPAKDDNTSTTAGEEDTNEQATDEPTELNGLSYTSAEAFETAVKNAIASYSKTYKPGTNLQEKSSEQLSISWRWPFDKDASTSGGVAGEAMQVDDPINPSEQDDEKDTYLGDQAVTSGSEAKITLTVTATVTQID